MKKHLLLLLVLFGLLQSAHSAPIGWYDLSATWRDGEFNGKFFYDSDRITEIDGTLVDMAQTTAISKIVNPEDPQLDSWVFLANTVFDLYDAGFYLNLTDLGAGLTLDTLADNGLYDWSNDFAYYVPSQLNDSPLRAFSITPHQDTPEPGTLALFVLGLSCCMIGRRR